MYPTFLIIFALIISISSSFSSSSSQPSISVFPKTLSKSSNKIQIHYSNVASPSPLDWLGIYSPPNSPHPYFIGYFLLSSVSSTWQSGSGNFSFPLVNLRSPYQFRLFRWNESEAKDSPFDLDHNPLPGTKHLLAESEVVRFESGHGPDQVHLSFTDRDDEMRVMFVTDDGNVCFLKWGLGEGNLDNVAKTTLERYEREDMCDFPANSSIGWRDPGYVHSGIMSNLKKGKRYYYKVGSDSGGWSNIYSFISRNEDSDEAIAFLFGDMGTATPYSTFLRTQDESISTIKWILRDIEALGDKPSFISHIGDISYARGFSWLWDNFFDQIEPVASKVPYHVCIGNHEYDWPLQPWKPDWSSKLYGTDGGGECGVPYSIKFSMPGNFSEPTGTRAPATRNLFYSFDMGAVHFLYMSTETNFLKGSSQYNFIKHDLESVNRRRTPFVVVQGHRPMYTTSNEITDTPIRRKMMEHLEPLFVRNRVTLALWGHVHRYERFCPMKNFTCGGMSLDGESDSKGFTTHIVIGMAGQDYQPIWHPRQDHPTDPIYPQPQQSLYRGGEFGYTRLFATREKLTLSYVGNHDGEVHDSVEFLASGQVVSSDGITDIAGNKVESAGESTFSRYVKVASLLVLGMFAGYVLGYLSHARQKNASQQRWVLEVKEQGFARAMVSAKQTQADADMIKEEEE